MLFRRIFDFFIYSNLFISACACLMTWHTAAVFYSSSGNDHLLLFVFFATLASYSFHWWLTPADVNPSSHRLKWLQANRHIHVVLLVLGGLGAAWEFTYLRQHWQWLGIGALITFLYSAPMIPLPLFRLLRKIAVGKTIVLAFAWTYVTAGLPLLTSGHFFEWPGLLYFVSRYLFLYAICIVFDYRDRDYDRSIGIRSLITWLSPGGVKLLFWASLVLSIIATLYLTRDGIEIQQIVLLILPCVIAGLLFGQALRNHSDLFYYFILDGLMALSAILAAASLLVN